MGADRERLWNRLSTTRTGLTDVSGTDFNHGFDGAFSLVFQNLQELSPAHIRDGSGERVVLEHPLNVEMLHIESIKLVNKRIRHFVVEVASGSLHPLMGFRQQDSGFLTPLALFGGDPMVLIAFGTPFEASLRLTKLGLRLLEKAGVGNGGMLVGEGGEVLNPDINSHLLPRWFQRRGFDFTDEAGIPAIGFLAYRAGFWFTLPGTMQAKGNLSDFGEGECLAFPLHAGSPTGIGEGAIPAEAFEARESRFLLACLHPAEEVVIGCVEASQAVLSYLGVELCERQRLLFEQRQLTGLLDIANCSAFLLVGVHAFCEGIVVEVA